MLPARQHRFFLGGAQVSVNKSVAFLNGIPWLTNAIAMASAIHLGRLVEAMALSVEFPAVVAATYTVLLDTTVMKARAAVAAMFANEAGASLLVAKDNEVLAQQT